MTGRCRGGALGAAHDRPGVVCEDFDTDRNGSGSIEWTRLPKGAHPCDPLATLLDPTDDVIGYSIGGGPSPLGVDGQICSEDAAYPNALNTCYPVPSQNDWHLHSPYEGCDTDDSYDLGAAQFDSSCAPEARAHSGFRSLHLGRHLSLGDPNFDTYRFRQTSAFVLDPVTLGTSATLEFWQIMSVCDDLCINMSVGETTAGGQVQASLLDPNTGIFGRWQRLDPMENGYDATPQSIYTLCEFDPGDDQLPPGDETMCLDDSPQWARIGDVYGTDRTCTTDTDGNDPNNLDCGRTTNRTVDPSCSWVADPNCGSYLENGSAGTGVWARSKFDLSALSNREARIRFAFQGGGGWGFGTSESFLENPFGEPVFEGPIDDGWYIDDIEITGVVENDPLCEDADQDGFSCSGDASCACALQPDCGCNDANTYPGAPELCDGIDNNCDTIIPVDEIDGDGDGVAPCQGDCTDTDAGSIRTPAEVSGVGATPGGGGTMVEWGDEAPTAGTGTTYDVFTGLISDLHGSRGFKAGQCVREDLTATSWLAPAGDDPPLGDARYYLLRGQNGCPAGDGTWGDEPRNSQVLSSPHTCN
ncbi:MAG TPA: putative metal-binding motif-containing protein [Candidatus Saccharimonadales bacterium]|nr:putative metal-binding motif-containing protein [Candidatus Saccharimonadales bacterium]